MALYILIILGPEATYNPHLNETHVTTGYKSCNFFLIIFFKDKSRNLFKFVSVLLSASVERVGVSRMRDFFLIFDIWDFDLKGFFLG